MYRVGFRAEKKTVRYVKNLKYSPGHFCDYNYRSKNCIFKKPLKTKSRNMFHSLIFIKTKKSFLINFSFPIFAFFQPSIAPQKNIFSMSRT